MLSSEADGKREWRASGPGPPTRLPRTARKCCHRRMAHFLAMSTAQVKFTVHV